MKRLASHDENELRYTISIRCAACQNVFFFIFRIAISRCCFNLSFKIAIMSSVGERIKEQRSKLGWTQEKLASVAKMSTGFLSDLETGKRNVSADYLMEISHALGVSLDYLMKGDSSKPVSREVQIPASLSDFARQAQLSFSQTLMLLDMQRQIVAHRSHSKSDDLEKVDWKDFYESMKRFLK